MNRYRVLVVDEYADAAELMCLLVEQLGHDGRFARSATDALAVAAEFLPDVVILDLGLPYKSGVELARVLRRLLAGRPLYVAALTAWDHPDVPSAAREAGCNFHALKPANMDLIPRILRLAAQLFASERYAHADS